jgi:hypothetical protein
MAYFRIESRLFIFQDPDSSLIRVPVRSAPYIGDEYMIVFQN